MKQRPRTYYTETQKPLMWECWRKGVLSSRTHSCSTEITHRYNAFWRRQAVSSLLRVVAQGWR